MCSSDLGLDIDPTDGHVWGYERCASGSAGGPGVNCDSNRVDPIFKFDRNTGEVLANFGADLFVTPHGIHVDSDGNVWVTDFAGNEAGTRGHQVFKFSPTGKLLLTLGAAGVAGHGPDTFDRPTDVAVASNGDIFVTDGHGTNNRVVKFAQDGRFIKAWGHTGTGPGEFNQPHTIALDSAGRVFVGDRSNSRIQVFDPDGTFIVEWTQFGRPSGMFIDENDRLYVTDSTSNARNNPGRKRGIYIGSARDGSVTAFIPDPDLDQQEQNRISGASGITADLEGNVYAADVGPHRVRKHLAP